MQKLHESGIVKRIHVPERRMIPFVIRRTMRLCNIAPSLKKHTRLYVLYRSGEGTMHQDVTKINSEFF